jgi:hypothetical protein
MLLLVLFLQLLLALPAADSFQPRVAGPYECLPPDSRISLRAKLFLLRPSVGLAAPRWEQKP